MVVVVVSDVAVLDKMMRREAVAGSWADLATGRWLLCLLSSCMHLPVARIWAIQTRIAWNLVSTASRRS